MIRAIIHLLSFPVGEDEYKHVFRIDEMVAQGFRVEVWDCTPLLAPRIFDIRGKVQFEGAKATYRWFHSKAEVLRALMELDSSVFVFAHPGYSAETLFIFRALSLRRVPYGCFCSMLEYIDHPLPEPSTLERLRTATLAKVGRRVWRMAQRVSPARLLGAFFGRIPFRSLGVCPATAIFFGGEKSYEYLSRISIPYDHTTKRVPCHLWDYDEFLRLRAAKPQDNAQEKSAVFLDCDLCYHPNFVRKRRRPVTPDRYLRTMNAFFDRFEESSGLNVVIAAHPRSNPGYEGKRPFGDRRIVRYQTPELVRDAAVVFLHHTQALSYAVLFDKPFAFLTTDELRKDDETWYQLRQAGFFAKRPVNLDSEGEVAEFLSKGCGRTDEGLRKKYINDYIKSDRSEEIPTSQIVGDYLKGLSLDPSETDGRGTGYPARGAKT